MACSAVVVGNGLHLHIIADDHALPAQAPAQQAGDHHCGQRGRMLRVKPGVKQMSHHDHARPAPAEGLRIGQQIAAAVPTTADVGEAQMRIAPRAALAGKVLEYGNDSGASQPLPEGQGVFGDQPGIRAETAPQSADGRIVRIAVHVRHGREIHGNAQ